MGYSIRDKLRIMTEEEIAHWYFDEFFPSCPYCADTCPEHNDCKRCLTDWLKSMKRAVWMTGKGGWIYCSECGSEPPLESNYASSYCPSCGARMEGDSVKK